MPRADVRYVCQRAANAIITEIGPYRVSSDALQSINQFLDEFLEILLSSCASFDLSRIKNAVFDLLPSSSLGKNAIVEAELEVKTFTETEPIDYGIHERMRRLGTDGQPFPLERALVLLRGKCVELCALADKDDDTLLQLPPPRAEHNEEELVISPVVVIYVTTVLEHIAEYVLNAIAMVAESDDTEYIRVREVFLGLNEDTQVGAMFHRSELREKLEKRASAYGYHVHQPPPPHSPLPPPSGHLPSPAPSPVTSFKKHTHARDTVVKGDHYFDTTFDDDQGLDYEYEDEKNDRHGHFSMYSIRSNDSTQSRPLSMMSNSTSNGTIRTTASSSSKKGFKLFKRDKRGSVALDTPAQRASMPVTVSVYNPEVPCLNFDDLIRSGNTMRVSLTPNRLRSIEVHDQMADDDDDDDPPEPEMPWDGPLKSTSDKTRHSRPVSPPTTGRVGQKMEMAKHEKPIISRPQPPKKSELAEPPAPFENPRSAPKPPAIQSNTVDHAPPTPASSITSHPSQSRQSSSFDLPEFPRKDEVRVLRRSSSGGRKKLRESSNRTRDLVPELPTTIKVDSVSHSSKRTTLPSSASHQSVRQTRRTRSTLLVDEEGRKVHFTHEPRQEHVANNAQLERPSSMVAKRASMISSRPQSFHESFALNADKRVLATPSRASTAGSVEMSIKAWDEILGQNTLHRSGDSTISVVRRRADACLQTRPKLERESKSEETRSITDMENSRNGKKADNAVLNKVLKFERAKADLQDEPAVHDGATSPVPRHDRIMYLLQRDAHPPPAPERSDRHSKTAQSVDMAVQTEPLACLPPLGADHSGLLTVEHRLRPRKDMDGESILSERGMLEGDEEWFLRDEDWEDTPDQENAVVDWLLGDA
ncbi:hypothetical protein DFQ30_008975 [Apophysomyces sp. BC1015]|nr:hypothetical protein DFQ30_008975 [Apophysomyces sp. BC1015]KAG0175347.1 hypothetical protein DFQ29_007167 [Apophysomyces sp. BC1021]